MLRRDDGALRTLTWNMLLFGAIFLVPILMADDARAQSLGDGAQQCSLFAPRLTHAIRFVVR